MSPITRKFLKALRWAFAALFAGATAGVLALAAAYFYLAPQLPSIESLKDVRFQVPLRVFSADDKLLAEFGEKKRAPIRYGEVPPAMVHAFLAAEDDRFFSHPGVDYQGLLRAAMHLIRTGEKGQGGSTITMQVARNFFLSSEKTYIRKLNEIFLALKIERELSKQEILELYLNKIYLGHRSYGVGAAAQVYYDKTIEQLTLAQTAMIAGLPKAPSRYNPIVNSSRALERRAYVLGRMHELGYITDIEYQESMEAPVSAQLHALTVEVEAPYVAEMVRAEMVERYGPEAYTEGYRVITTVDSGLQQAASNALRSALLAYDRRHGYRGPERHVDLAQLSEPVDRDRVLEDLSTVGGLHPALVAAVEGQQATVYMGKGREHRLDWDALSWARPYVNHDQRGPKPKEAADILKPGDIVRVEADREGGWVLSQVPEVSGALVSLSPDDGAVQSLVGGFDYFHSKFNRVTQARRQPGSNFKPFIYSAALEAGFTAASLINDAPVVFEDPALENTWRPENYSGRFYGPTRLREALVNSRNLVSIRLLRAIGVEFAVEYLTRFGFQPDELPHNLSLALGSASVTPLQLASGYAVFANGGYRIEPYWIRRIEDADGKVLFDAEPAVVCEECVQRDLAATDGVSEDSAAAGSTTADNAPDRAGTEAPGGGETSAGSGAPGADAAGDSADPKTEPQPENLAERAISPQNAYLINSMMRDVVKRGTGRRALALGRSDLAGKTGTTNDQRDAWFSGFTRHTVTTAWVGFDQVQPLGRRETGSRAALPMWIDYMRVALDGVPEYDLEQPAGLVTVRIDPKTGLRAASDSANAIFESFRNERVPDKMAEAQSGSEGESARGTAASGAGVPEQIF